MNRCRQRHIRAGNRHKCVVTCGCLHGQKSKAHTGGRENNAFPYFLAEMKIRRRGKKRCAPPASIAGGVGMTAQLADTDDPRIGRGTRRNREMQGARTAAGTAHRRLPVKRRQKRTQAKGSTCVTNWRLHSRSRTAEQTRDHVCWGHCQYIPAIPFRQEPRRCFLKIFLQGFAAGFRRPLIDKTAAALYIIIIWIN
jgi:hypothetical protein